MKGSGVADVGGQDLEHLMEDTKKFPKLLRGLKPKEVEENRKLQRGIVLNACHFAAEVLDVEGGGVSEDAAKLIARDMLEMLQESLFIYTLLCKSHL